MGVLSKRGRQKLGMLLSQFVQSCRRIEKDRIRAAIAMVDGAKSIDVVSERGKYVCCLREEESVESEAVLGRKITFLTFPEISD